MKKYEAIYEELRKKYTDEEIAESMLIPEDMTVAERDAADEELRRLRLKMLKEQTEEERIFSDLMRLRIVIEDYISQEKYSEEHSFGKYLEEYARILNVTKKKLSEDLAVHYTRLSRIINDHEDPNVGLVYRLEKHSGGMISALKWWRLVVKKQEYEIKIDDKKRQEEEAKVKNSMKFVA